MLLKYNLLWLGPVLLGAAAQQPAQGDTAWAYLVSHNNKAAAGMASYCKTLGVTSAADCNAKFLTPHSGNLPPSSVTANAANTCAERASLSQAESKRITDLMKTDFNKISREASGQSIHPDLAWKTGNDGRRFRLFYSIAAREEAGQKIIGNPIDGTKQAIKTGIVTSAVDKALGAAAAGAAKAAGPESGAGAGWSTALTSWVLGAAVAGLGGLDAFTDYFGAYTMPWTAGVEPDAIFYEGDTSGVSIKDGSSVVYDQIFADKSAVAVASDNAESSGGADKKDGDGTKDDGGTNKDGGKKDADGKTGSGGDGGSGSDEDVWDKATFNSGDLQPELDNSTPMIPDETTRTSFQRCVEAEEAKLWQFVGSVTVDPDAESPEARKANALQQLSKFGICDTHVLGSAFCQNWKNEQAKHPIPPDEVNKVQTLVTGTHLCISSLIGPEACKILKEELWKRYVVRDEVAQVTDGLFTVAPNSDNARLPLAADVLGNLGKKLVGDKGVSAAPGADSPSADFPLLGSARPPTRPATAKELQDGLKKGAGFIPSLGALHPVPGSHPGKEPFGHDEL